MSQANNSSLNVHGLLVISTCFHILQSPFNLITLIEVFTVFEGWLYAIKPCHSSPLPLLNKLTPEQEQQFGLSLATVCLLVLSRDTKRPTTNRLGLDWVQQPWWCGLTRHDQSINTLPACFPLAPTMTLTVECSIKYRCLQRSAVWTGKLKERKKKKECPFDGILGFQLLWNGFRNDRNVVLCTKDQSCNRKSRAGRQSAVE